MTPNQDDLTDLYRYCSEVQKAYSILSQFSWIDEVQNRLREAKKREGHLWRRLQAKQDDAMMKRTYNSYKKQRKKVKYWQLRYDTLYSYLAKTKRTEPNALRSDIRFYYTAILNLLKEK